MHTMQQIRNQVNWLSLKVRTAAPLKLICNALKVSRIWMSA